MNVTSNWPGLRALARLGRPSSPPSVRGLGISPFTLLVLAVTLLAPVAAQAYPPNPYHLIYGLVRDEYGTPLNNNQVQVFLVTTSGVPNAAFLQPGLAIDVNYQLPVPMDTLLKPDLYRSNAVPAGASFKMLVVVGNTTNVPIVSLTVSTNLGQPTKMTQINLFLGTDANGDGIPDEFELAFLAALGSDLGLIDLNAGMDLAHDGRTLMQEYFRGTYAFDLNNTPSPFPVRIVSLSNNVPLLEFPMVPPQTYSVLGSTDLQQWTVLNFRLSSEGPSGLIRTNYAAAASQTLQVQVVSSGSGPKVQFFRIISR